METDESEILRAELFSVDQLRRHAAALAEGHQTRTRRGPDRLLRRLADNERVLVAAHEVVSRAAAGGRRVALAAEWLLDNFWMIEQQIVLARRHLPPGYNRQLPQLASGPNAGFPRVYDMALEVISHLDGRIDAETVTGFVTAYQGVHALKLGELWAFPIMLRLALIENLRRVVSRIARRREDRDAAILWSSRIVEAAGDAPQRLPHVLARLAEAKLRLTSPFVEELTERLSGQGPAVAFILTWLEQKLAEHGTSAVAAPARRRPHPGRRPHLDGEQRHVPLAHQCDELEGLRRDRQRGRADPTRGPVGRLREPGFRDAQSLPAGRRDDRRTIQAG